MATLFRGPPLPVVGPPAGWVWPPIEGRETLADALVHTTTTAQELAPGEWRVESSSGHRLFTLADRYDDFDVAHDAIVRFAQQHAALVPWLSPGRCLVLARDGDRLALWQCVARAVSVWRSVQDALSTRDERVVLDAVVHARRSIVHAAHWWGHAPSALPATLETIGAERGDFVSLVPHPDRLSDGVGRAPSTVALENALLRMLKGAIGGAVTARAIAFLSEDSREAVDEGT